MAACWDASSPVWYSGSWLPIIRLDQSNMRCRSSWGTPRSSAMTTSGSSAAMSVTKSALALLDDRVDDAVGGGVDPLVELVDHPGGESLVDQAAVAGVEGRVHVQHEQLLLGQVVGPQIPDERGLLGRGEVLVVAVHLGAVGVGGHGPEPGPVRSPPATTPGRSSAGRRTSGGARRRRTASSRSGRCRRSRPPGGRVLWLCLSCRMHPPEYRTHCPIHWMVRPVEPGVNERGGPAGRLPSVAS